MVLGYCLKDRKKVNMTDVVYTINKINRPVAKGKCPTCGGNVQKLLKAEETPADIKAKVAKAKAGGGTTRTGSRKSKRAAPRKSRASRKSRSSRR